MQENGQFPSVDNVYDLPTRIDISSAAAVYAEISKAISGHKDVTFNASKVDRITTPGVQLLLAVANTVKSKSGSFIISWPSENFRKTFLELGFSNQLKEWTGSDV